MVTLFEKDGEVTASVSVEAGDKTVIVSAKGETADIALSNLLLQLNKEINKFHNKQKEVYLFKNGRKEE